MHALGRKISSGIVTAAIALTGGAVTASAHPSAGSASPELPPSSQVGEGEEWPVGRPAYLDDEEDFLLWVTEDRHIAEKHQYNAGATGYAWEWVDAAKRGEWEFGDGRVVTLRSHDWGFTGSIHRIPRADYDRVIADSQSLPVNPDPAARVGLAVGSDADFFYIAEVAEQ